MHRIDEGDERPFGIGIYERVVTEHAFRAASQFHHRRPRRPHNGPRRLDVVYHV